MLPVYNGERYLRAAVLSVLSQSISDLELIIIDDCSTDLTSRILSEFDDARITIIRNPINMGVIFSRNLAIEIATGDYIALMDSDDISLPTRFECQLNFLRLNEDVDIVGTGARLIDEAGRRHSRYEFPCDDCELFVALHFLFPFANPSLMFRARALRALGGYSLNALYVEDYELLVRHIVQLRFANLRAPLLELRKHSANSSLLSGNAHILASVAISRKLIEDMLKKPIQYEVVDCIHSLGMRSPSYGIMAIDMLHELYLAMKIIPRCSKGAVLRHYFGERIFLTGLFSNNLTRALFLSMQIDPLVPIRISFRFFKRVSGFLEIK